MSHEFRTPLGSILSVNSLLADELDGPLSPEQHKQVAFVSSAARELSDMVDDLLDLAKIEAGRISISPAWFDMFDLFSALRGMFRPIVDASAVDLIFEEPVGLPRLYTDDKKLAQILRNFISNSLKFTTRGEVRVSARLKVRTKYVLPSATPASVSRRSCMVHCSRTFSGRLAIAETPARHRSRPVAVQALCRPARRRGRNGQQARGRLDLFRDHSTGARSGEYR